MGQLSPFGSAWPWPLQAPELVRQSHNEVYRCRVRGEEAFARITFLEHRSALEVAAEVAWMQALYEAGLPVVKLLPSEHGALLEKIVHGGRDALAIVTAKAPGRPGRKPDDFRLPVMAAWAQLLARFHAHARAYEPAAPQRPAWDQDQVLRTALAADDARTREAQEVLAHVTAWMRGLPRSRSTFGITHADLHLGNLAIDETAGAPRLTAFDFDDACEHFFLHDLAVAVTSLRKAAWESPDAFDLEHMEGAFLEAYAVASAHQPLALEEDLRHLPRFVAYRIAVSTCWAARSAEMGELDADMSAWFERSLPWWLATLEALEPSLC